MKNKKIKYIALVILGVIAIFTAFFFYRQNMFALGGGFMGFGTASFMVSLSKLLSKPEVQKAAEIEENDERNLAIRGKAEHISNEIIILCLGIACIFYLHIGEFVTGMVFCALLFILFISNLIARAVYRHKM